MTTNIWVCVCSYDSWLGLILLDKFSNICIYTYIVASIAYDTIKNGYDYVMLLNGLDFVAMIFVDVVDTQYVSLPCASFIARIHLKPGQKISHRKFFVHALHRFCNVTGDSTERQLSSALIRPKIRARCILNFSSVDHTFMN